MNCQIVEELIPSLITGTLAEDESDLVMVHLETCSSCRGWLAEAEDLKVIWEQPTHVLPAPDFVESVMEEVNVMGEVTSWHDAAPSNIGRNASTKRSTSRRSHFNLQRASLYHFGFAASLTFILFNLGVFEHLSSHVIKIDSALTNQVMKVMSFTSQLHI